MGSVFRWSTVVRLNLKPIWSVWITVGAGQSMIVRSELSIYGAFVNYSSFGIFNSACLSIM
jgi:hypothetical protein